MDFANSFTTDLCNVESQLFFPLSQFAVKYLKIYGNTTWKPLDRVGNSIDMIKNIRSKESKIETYSSWQLIIEFMLNV